MPKSRKRKVRRARDAAGHFVKRKKARRAKPAKRRKARKTGVTRVKRALGRKRSNGRFVKRGKHRVRGYRRKVAGRSRKKLVRSHLSYENPVKRKRRRARRSQEETVTMSENPRRRRRRRTGKARRRHHSVAAENPRKRSKKRRSPARRRARRRASVTASVPAVIRRRRKSGRKARTTRSPGTIKVVIAGLGRRGGSRSRKRRSPSRKRKHARKRRKSHRRSYSGGYTPRSHQLTAENGLFENPLGGYTLENPLSGGELALAGLTGAIGFVVGDMLDRYLAVRQYAPATVPTGATALAPAQAVATAPSIMRILAQAALAAAPLAGAYYTHRPMAKAALQGLGLGVLFRLGGQLINQFIVTKYIAPGTGTVGTFVGPLYQDETQAGTAAAASNLAGLPLGLGSPARQQPRALGAPRVLTRPSIPYKGDPGPRAVAAAPAGVGNCGDNPDCSGGQNADGSQDPQQPAPPQAPVSSVTSSTMALNGVPSDWFPDN